MRPLVLSVDSDYRLLRARHALLEDAGFDVTSSTTTYEGVEMLSLQRYAAVVIGYSVSFTERQLFGAEVGERWRIPVIALHQGNPDFKITSDDEMEMTEGADDLIGTLDALLFHQQQQSA